MRVVRASSLDEYASWYLRREARKRNSDLSPGALQGQVVAMWQHHGGKLRDWFNASTRWHIVELDLVGERADLIFLEIPWTKEEGLVIRDGPNYRLLDRVGDNAIASRYLARSSARKHKAFPVVQRLLGKLVVVLDPCFAGFVKKERLHVAVMPRWPTRSAATG
jgi:hypothetical protein